MGDVNAVKSSRSVASSAIQFLHLMSDKSLTACEMLSALTQLPSLKSSALTLDKCWHLLFETRIASSTFDPRRNKLSTRRQQL